MSEDAHDLMRRILNYVKKPNPNSARDCIVGLLEIVQDLEHPQRLAAIDYLQVILISGDRCSWLAELAHEEVLYASNRMKTHPVEEMVATLDGLQMEEDRLELAQELLQLRNDARFRTLLEGYALEEQIQKVEQENMALAAEIEQVIDQGNQVLGR